MFVARFFIVLRKLVGLSLSGIHEANVIFSFTSNNFTWYWFGVYKSQVLLTQFTVAASSNTKQYKRLQTTVLHA